MLLQASVPTAQPNDQYLFHLIGVVEWCRKLVIQLFANCCVISHGGHFHCPYGPIPFLLRILICYRLVNFFWPMLGRASFCSSSAARFLARPARRTDDISSTRIGNDLLQTAILECHRLPNDRGPIATKPGVLQCQCMITNSQGNGPAVRFMTGPLCDVFSYDFLVKDAARHV